MWNYISDEGIDVPPIYFAHRRQVFQRDGMLMAVTQHLRPGRGRARLRGHGALPHGGRRRLHGLRRVDGRDASTSIIAEVAGTRLTERGATRADDRISEAGMEDRKREGYF